jgi:Ca2+-binding RTX toxin-like protein
MPNVTVQGAHGSVSLAYDVDPNAALAQYVATAIANGIGSSTIIPADSAHSPTPPPLPTGKIGEFVQLSTPAGPVTIPKGYNYLVDAAPAASFIDDNTNAGQDVLAGSGNLAFDAVFGSGSVIGGGGSDNIIIGPTNANPWLIAIGNGNSTVKALGSGNDTISTGTGNDSIVLGSGSTAVTTSGSATITAGSGSETVTAFGSDLIYGASSKLLFAAGGGATVFGGTGSDTITGGTGPDVFQGGTGGNNSITAGAGAATLFGGGSGDQLFGNGSGAQILYAGALNETLTGSSASGASDTFVGSAGNTTVVASPGANNGGSNPTNLFEFIHDSAGGTELVQGLTSIGQVDLHLSGYASNDTGSVASQNNTGGNLNVTLTDGTQITFQNITSPLTNSNFS